MPGKDGFEICREVRKTSTVPILMITARGKDYDKIMGLDDHSVNYNVLPGSAKQLLDDVFDRFYTSSGAANPQGTGLGLFIANQIAQRHNADIRMENKAESGCRITVVFWKHRPGNNPM